MNLASRITTVIAAGLLTVATAAGESHAVASYRPDVIIVKLKSDAAQKAGRTHGAMATGIASLDNVSTRLGALGLRRTVPNADRPGRITDRHGLRNYYTVELPPGTDINVALAEYTADPNVELAEPDYIMPMYGVPNDPDYAQQWTHSFINDRDIDTEEAWDYEVGDSTVLFGNVDSGFLYDHPDLRASTWVNPGEDLDSDGVVWDADDLNGVDDDGNGYIDDLIGYDFMPAIGGCWPTEDCDGPDNDPDDITGHGTHVGGIACATTGNGEGVAGIAGGRRSEHRPGAKVLALRAGYLASDGNGYVIMTACAEAIDYAVARGVTAINCSWGASGTVIRTAVLNAIAAGIVVTKAAGNDNNEVSDVLNDLAGVLSVASLDKTGGKSSFSSYGTWVEISAPGSEIYNTYGSGGVASYATLGGTSMAAPTVAGVALLLKSHHPWFTKTEIDTLLVNYADTIDADISPGLIGKMGSGRVNARRVLEILSTADFAMDTQFGKTPLTVNFTDVSPNAPSGPYLYTFGDDGDAATANATHEYTSPGLYSVTFTASGPSGPHTRKRPEAVVVVEDTIQYESIELEIGSAKAPIPVRLHNTHPMSEIVLPFKLTGLPTVRIDSLTLGPRTAGWSAQLTYDNGFNGEIAFRLRPPAGETLPAGDGYVANLWVRSGFTGTAGQVETVDSATFGSYDLRLISNWASFKPDFVGGTVTMILGCECLSQGDLEEDGQIDSIDLSRQIDVVFFGGSDIQDPKCPATRGDFNNNGFADSVDLSEIIDHVFFGGPGPVDPCAP